MPILERDLKCGDAVGRKRVDIDVSFVHQKPQRSEPALFGGMMKGPQSASIWGLHGNAPAV
jgi:hypothetical protein